MDCSHCQTYSDLGSGFEAASLVSEWKEAKVEPPVWHRHLPE